VICTLGDLVLDVVVRLEGPIAPDTDTWVETRVGAGGQAANVAAWVAALGGRARLVAKTAEDAPGRLVRELLSTSGVDVVGPLTDTGTGTVVSLATPDGRRAMLSDRGVSATLSTEELDPAWLAGCEWLHVSGYALAVSPVREAALAAAGHARGAGARVSLDLASVAAIEAAGPERFRAEVAALAPDAIFGNEEEWAATGELRAEVEVVKRGPRGCTIRRAGGAEDRDALPAEFVDATGAGDAFCAGFLLGGADTALTAAARCVSQLGATPGAPTAAATLRP
jgi:sugar/nucleoside kinase (ribokinase family)